MRPEVKKAGADAARSLSEVLVTAFIGGLCAACFLVPVGAVALVVRWLW